MKKIVGIFLLTLLIPSLALAQNATGGTPAAPAKKSRPQKPSVKIGNAKLVSDEEAPKLISTTGGKGADTQGWTNIAQLKQAADQHNPDACYDLGQMYLDGTPDTPKNITKALLYLGDAARLGNTQANFRLGKIYSDGTEVERDYTKALAHYTAAARAGDAVAQHNLGAMYSTGRGVKRDYAEGLAWLIVSARQNKDAAESEKKLRDFLSKSPQTITAAEARAEEIAQELSGQPPKAAKKDPFMPKPEPIKIDVAPIPVTPMTIDPPVFTPGGGTH